MTDRYRRSEGSVEWTEKSNSPFSLSRFLVPPPLPSPITPKAAAFAQAQMSLKLTSRISHPHVYTAHCNFRLSSNTSHKSTQGYSARIILLKTTLRITVLLHITKLVLTMRFWLSPAFSVALMVHVANGAKITNSSTPVRTNRNGETIVCNQYIGQGVETSDAIKKLDEKLDQLIKLLQPPAFPGKMHSTIASNFHDFIYESLHFLCYTSQFSNKCKEIAGKRNHDD